MRRKYVANEVITFLKPLVISLTIAAYIALLTNIMVRDNINWFEGIKRLGFQNIILLVWLILIIIHFIGRAKENKEYSDAIHELIVQVISIFGKSLEYPSITRKINVHYYSHRIFKGKHFLIKERSFSYEREYMPHNFPLETINVEEDNLVTCDAFNKKKIVYEELPADHTIRYGPRIKEKVDPSIRWILACPVWFTKTEKEPDGMIVLFGGEPFIRTDMQRNELESLLIEFSKAVSKMLKLEIGFKIKKYEEI